MTRARQEAAWKMTREGRDVRMYVLVDWVEQIFQRNVGFSFDIRGREPYSQVEFTKRFSHLSPFFFFLKSHPHCFEKNIVM